MSGVLYVCATPIGNLEDITIRVLRILKEVDIIAAEDTRQSVKLLNRYEIKTPLTSYHEHNKDEKGPKIIKMLKDGKNAAVITDAGMPGISDPGEDLIRLCYENGIKVTAAPGATAAVTALVLSGLSSRAYCFEGFLPSGKKQRKEVIEKIRTETRTVVLYEAPHRLLSTLKEIYDVIGNRNSAVIRELTKKHETVNKGGLYEIIEFFTENEPKGEFVLVIEGISRQELEEDKKLKFEQTGIEEHYKDYIAQGFESKEAMKMVARDRGIGKREVYSAVNKLERPLS